MPAPTPLTALAPTTGGPLSRRDRRWLRRAARAAGTATTGEYRLAAVAVRGGSHVATATNRYRNNPLWLPDLPRENWSTHAEDACLRRAARADGATVYVARVTPGGRTAAARPCPNCLRLLADAGVTKIVYTTHSGAAVERLPRTAHAA